jgi:hypothetical protein
MKAVAISVSAVAIGLAILTATRAAIAEERFIVCIDDWTGCQAHYFVSCEYIAPGTGVNPLAEKVCKQERAYSSYGVRVLVNEGGGRCGHYRWEITCR